MAKKKTAEKQEKEIKQVQTWTITVTTYEDGGTSMERINDGFNALELIGIADFISWEVREQIIGRIVPDTIKRKVIVP